MDIDTQMLEQKEDYSKGNAIMISLQPVPIRARFCESRKHTHSSTSFSKPLHPALVTLTTLQLTQAHHACEMQPTLTVSTPLLFPTHRMAGNVRYCPIMEG